MKEGFEKTAALFLISVLIIAYELSVMRFFSVTSWSSFGSMVISIALLGNGLAGTLLTLLRKRVSRNPGNWLFSIAVLIPLSIALSQIIAGRIPFNPIFLVSDTRQILYIAAFYLTYAVPFFLGALFVGVVFMTPGASIHSLYFWNMAGSGIGGFIVIFLMYYFKPLDLSLPLLGIAFLAILFCSLTRDEGYRVDMGRFFVGSLFCMASVLLFLGFGETPVSDYKSVSYARSYPDAKLVHYHYGPEGEYHVYDSSYFHFAPGLSDNAALNVVSMPEKAFMGLFVDGNGPIGIMGALKEEEKGYLSYLPMAAPYLLREKPEVLIIRAAGGIGASTALAFRSARVDVVDPSASTISLLRDSSEIASFNGGLFKKPEIRIIEGEPRAFCKTTGERYNIIELSLVDSLGLSSDGGYAVEENFTYTREAIADYMQALSPDGILSITVWNKLDPPRNVPKLISTVVQSLYDQGYTDAENRVFMFDLLYSTATILIKKSPFTEFELSMLKGFCETRSFDVCYYPGIEPREKDFESILAVYRGLFLGKEQKQGTQLIPSDLYHFSLRWLTEGKAEELYDSYIFDIRPASDDRPYFSSYIKPSTVPDIMDQLSDVSDEWGYLLIVATFIISIAAGLIIMLLPITGRLGSLKGKKIGGVILYFSCLGVAYMMIEIYLIQKFALFLSEPIYAVSIVMTTLLVISGVGSLAGDKFSCSRVKRVRIAVLCIGAVVALYVFILPYLLKETLGAAFPVRVLISVACIAPAAFFMGIPFPSGLSALTERRERLLPWAWGMNGALSVTGTTLTRLLSVSIGYRAVLTAAVALYLAAGLVFAVNEVSD